MNLKNFFGFLLLFYGANSLSAQYRIIGNIEHLPNQKVYLNFLNDDLQKQFDTTSCINSVFIFKGGKIQEATHANLSTADGSIDDEFFFEKGTTTVTGDITISKEVMAIGGGAAREYNEYRTMDAPFMILRDSLYPKSFIERQSGDTVAANATLKQFNLAADESKLAERKFLLKHDDSPVSAYIISWLYVHAGTLEKGDSLMNLMTDDNRHSKYARYRKMMIEKMAMLETGKPVLHFSQTDTAGKNISTKNFTGKYFLIDFWASWCGPCRRENPNVLKAYQKYHAKGFEILAVSLDADRERWIAAIAKDSLPWTQVSDLKGWNNFAAQLYAVHGIPTNFLIDKSGIIIATSLQGNDLDTKLKEVFGE